AAFKGRNALATKLNGNYSHNQAWGASSVISPPIDLSDAVDPELRFQMWMETQANGDGWNVKVSNDGGLTWQVADALSPAYTHTLGGEPAWSGNFNAAAWHEVRVGLSAYAGQTVQLRFDFFSNDATTAAGVYVDELQVLDRS